MMGAGQTLKLLDSVVQMLDVDAKGLMSYQLSNEVSVVVVVVALRQIVNENGLALTIANHQRRVRHIFVFSAFLQHPDGFLLGFRHRWHLQVFATRQVMPGFLFRCFLLFWSSLVTGRVLFILFIIFLVCVFLVFLASFLLVLFDFLMLMSL